MWTSPLREAELRAGASRRPSTIRRSMRGHGIGGSVAGVAGINPTSSFRAIRSEEAIIMSDPILDEIWRVREELIKQHGGLQGYLTYIQKLDRARRQRGRRQTGKRPERSG